MEYVLVVKTEKLSQFISGRTGLITESNAEMLTLSAQSMSSSRVLMQRMTQATSR